MLSGRGNADFPLPPAMPPNWKAPLSVVDILIHAFAGGTGNNIIDGFVIRDICCAYIWEEGNV